MSMIKIIVLITMINTVCVEKWVFVNIQLKHCAMHINSILCYTHKVYNIKKKQKLQNLKTQFFKNSVKMQL